jgi:Fe-S-cluster containining protein
MIETQETIQGQKIAPGRTFCFSCGPDLECFNTCCRDKRLPLWPYDVLRLRRALDASSAEILAQYAEMDFDPVSGWPALRLKLDDQGRCPFVTNQGCKVYPHRPAACRIYPLARAIGRPKGQSEPEILYLRQETKGCLGWDQDREHTVETWTDDQDLALYNQANDDMTPLFFHPKRKGRLDLNPRQIHAVIVALYNLDIFSQMLDTPFFKDLFQQDQIETARESDEDLLLLGRDFLIKQLFT